MNITISIGNMDLSGIDRIREKMDPTRLSEAGATSLRRIVQRHLVALNRHKTRDWLNARSSTVAVSTHRYQEGAARTRIETGHGLATVVIPIPGISRAFHALNIAPKDKAALTIPINSIAYGKRAIKLQDEGWKLFRGKGKARRVLFGSKNGEVRGLYALLSRVRVQQDRSLLPSDQQVNAAVQRGAQLYINSLNGN